MQDKADRVQDGRCIIHDFPDPKVDDPYDLRSTPSCWLTLLAISFNRSQTTSPFHSSSPFDRCRRGGPRCWMANDAAVEAYMDANERNQWKYFQLWVLKTVLPVRISPSEISKPAINPPRKEFPPPVTSTILPWSAFVQNAGIHPVQFDDSVYAPSSPARTMMAGIWEPEVRLKSNVWNCQAANSTCESVGGEECGILSIDWSSRRLGLNTAIRKDRDIMLFNSSGVQLNLLCTGQNAEGISMHWRNLRVKVPRPSVTWWGSIQSMNAFAFSETQAHPQCRAFEAPHRPHGSTPEVRV